MTGWFAELSETTAKLSMRFLKPTAFLGGLWALVGSTSQKDTQQPPLLEIRDSCQLWMRDPFCVRLPSARDATGFRLLVAACRSGTGSHCLIQPKSSWYGDEPANNSLPLTQQASFRSAQHNAFFAPARVQSQLCCLGVSFGAPGERHFPSDLAQMPQLHPAGRTSLPSDHR